MKLTAAQTEELTFPVGCLVWYNFLPESSCDDEESSSPILKQGVVESITLDYGTKTLIYEIGYEYDKGNKIVDNDVAEDEVAYAPNCPVTIDTKLEGIVLLPERCSGKFVYTVMIYMDGCQSRYEFGVDAQRLKYRKIDTTTTNALVTSAQTTKNNEPDPPIVVTTAVIESLPKTLTVDTSLAVPASITLADGTRKHEQIDNNVSPMSSQQSLRPPPPQSSSPPQLPAVKSKEGRFLKKFEAERKCQLKEHKHGWRGCPNNPDSKNFNGIHFSEIQANERHEADVCKSLVPVIKLKLPEWIQRDRQLKKELFSYFTYSKVGHKKKRCSHDIELESNCQISINGFNKHSEDKSSNYAMHIAIRSIRSSKNDLTSAYEKVMDHLREYMKVLDPGAAERFTYEVASSNTGLHCPRESISNAVASICSDGSISYMSLIELPFVLRKTFHEHLNFLNSEELFKIGGCSIKAFGDNFGVPLKLCAPYCLVTGKSWKNVDEAVVIVKDSIKKHTF